MRCPVDQAELVMSERQGVEIDYCPTCRGVWLDRGELDKIIDRAPSSAPSSVPAPARYTDERRYSDDRRYDSSGQPPRKKKKESWLGDLFEFGG
jgi:Zn-finger nucleic acid-binding protein